MPRYYFDIRDGEYVQKDNEGSLLNGLAEVTAQAVKTLPDIARDDIPSNCQREFVVDVKDEDGRAVMTARLTLAIEVAAHVP